ncbi:AraC family transcriptional regulator [Kineosporia mesophila]|uniref:AraC family transcriptional regulator n=1 Tax=Kineosporia mesophila TaxID=566012 RepID=A0ABP6ZAH9_9ACTN|nr:AraC family transcriptional regulator [Kineosporia mesophila]
MDVVSEAIDSVRIGRADACWVTGTGSWGLSYPGHPVSGFHVLIRGTAFLISPDEAPRQLRSGDVVFTAAGAPHGLSHAPVSMQALPPAVLGAPPSVEDADAVFLCGAYWLAHGTAHPYLRSLPPVMAVTPDDGQLKALTDLLKAEVSNARPGGQVSRAALLDLMLTHVLRQWLAHNPADAPDNDPAIDPVLRQIREDPARPWTAQELSDRAGLPRREFSRRFTGVTGQPLRSYLSESRLSHGARLLKESDAPLASIARRAGYSTEFAFSAAFRREYGISPGRFRRADPDP